MKILVFSPSHGIWNLSYQMGLAAEALKKRGHEILYLTCDREYEKFCMAQASSGAPWSASPEAKAQICAQCRDRARLITDELALPTASINSFIGPEDRDQAKEIVSRATPENFRELICGGAPVGRLAMYEVVTQNMKRSLNFSPSEWSHYCDILENAAKTALGFAKACDRYKPDICLIEQTAYSYNRTCQLVAESKGIPAYFLTSSQGNIARTYELLVVGKSDPSIFCQQQLQQWFKSKDVPLTPYEAEVVTDHFIALVQGKLFSTAKEGGSRSIREIFGIRPDQKVLVATVSSYDEVFAVEAVGNFAWNTHSEIFETQLDWLKALLEFVRKRPELFLVIRVHPREFYAKNEAGRSEHAQSLEEELKNLPPNVAINWPSQKISLYDLAEEADVGLNAWSSAGAELSFFGIPVVVYFGQMLFYPESLNYSAKTREEYFAMIDRALKEGWSFERIRSFYRWYATQHVRLAIPILESFPYNVLRRRSFFRRAYAKLRRMRDPLYDFRTQVRRRSSELRAGERIEKLFQSGGHTFMDLPDQLQGGPNDGSLIRSELARLYKVMYRGAPPARPGTLQDRLWNAIRASEPGFRSVSEAEQISYR